MHIPIVHYLTTFLLALFYGFSTRIRNMCCKVVMCCKSQGFHCSCYARNLCFVQL